MAKLADSPLDPVAIELNRALEITNEARETADGLLARVAGYVMEIVQYLPKNYGDRFWFDASLIREMSKDWSEQQLFSSMIIPVYETNGLHAVANAVI